MKNSNSQIDRSVINYIHARDYFPEGEIEELLPWVDPRSIKWINKKFGLEKENFNLIFENIDVIMGKMVGDLVDIDKPNSGILRKTMHEVIHFEDFEDTNDWRFIVSLEENEFKTFVHRDGYKSMLDYVNDENTEKIELDWYDLTQWEQEAVIKLKPNDVLFYRPWLFHSFQDGILHYYRLKVI